MFRSDPSDELLIRSCTECEFLLRQHALDCDALDNAEYDDEAVPETAKMHDREQHTLGRWRFTLRRISSTKVYTRAGALAKMRVWRQSVDAGLAFDEDVTVLFRSLVFDLDLFFDDADCSCNKLRASPL